jgi:hypothetical protein
MAMELMLLVPDTTAVSVTPIGAISSPGAVYVTLGPTVEESDPQEAPLHFGPVIVHDTIGLATNTVLTL